MSHRTIGGLVSLVLLVGVGAGVASPAQAQGRGQVQPRNGACFYRDADFRGASICIATGDAAATLPSDLDDEISSIRVFGNAEVTVFHNKRFGGDSRVFAADVRNLRTEGLNDRISSIQVDGRRYGGGGGGGYRPSRPDPDSIIRSAYRDLLGREPDDAGLRQYRRRVLQDDWTEQDVRDDIRKSPEYRERTTMTPAKADQIVRQAYRSVLGREPDEAGARGYIQRVLRDGWTQRDVERELRNSAEYRNRRR